MARDLLKPQHLGDGVYVHDEGHGLAIAVNDHRNIVVHLDPEVLVSLAEYAKKTTLIK